MAFAASGKPIIWNPMVGAPDVPTLVSNLSSIYAQAGWQLPTSIPGGTKFTIQTPDGPPYLGAKVKVFDDSSGFACIQFMSLDEVRLGFAHHLRAASGKFYQVWANVCQTFISIAGVVHGVFPNTDRCSIAGGIPFVPKSLLGECGVDVGPILATEVWWSNGSDALDNNFRWTIRPLTWSACYNGDLMVAPTNTYSEMNAIRLIPMALTLPWPTFFGTVSRTKFFGADPNLTTLYFDPLIGWGTGTVSDSVGRIRGQLYDCALGSVFAPIDSTLITQGFTFINYMGDPPADLDASRFSSLWLLINPGSQASAYMY